MTNTMAEATMIKAWSPASYHWFKFSVPGDVYQFAAFWRFRGYEGRIGRAGPDVAIHTCEDVMECTH